MIFVVKTSLDGETQSVKPKHNKARTVYIILGMSYKHLTPYKI